MSEGEGVYLRDQQQHDIPQTPDSTATSCGSQPSSPNGEPDQFKQAFCTTDAQINSALAGLHMRLKKGCRVVQREIDTYLLLCACEKSLSGRQLHDMKVCDTLVPQYDTLPDITRYLPYSFTTDREPGIIAYYIQLLSPLKRKTRTRRGNPAAPLCPIEACVCLNLIQATLLGLYPRASKHPLWRNRVAIVACIHKLQTSSFETQTRFLALSHDILRVSFTEYIFNVRADFCPVEHEFLTRQASFLTNYDAACATLCDHVRQTCVQSNTWSWAHINQVSATSLDRISRMCRTRVISTHTPAVVQAMLPEKLQLAIHAHVVYPDPNTHSCASSTSCVEQVLHTKMLPWNMVRAQAARITEKYKETLFPATSACEKHICIKCVLSVNTRIMLRVSKLRMKTSTGKLTCVNCNSDDTVLQVNVFGKLLNIRNTAYFGCQECAALHEYNPVHPLMCTRTPVGVSMPMFDPHNVQRTWCGGADVHGAMALSTSRQMRAYAHATIAPPPEPVVRDRKHRCKWCARVCSARNILLLHQASVSIVSLTLCFKHMPPHHMIGIIQDTNALVRYIRMSAAMKAA
jgi:hypothetical protein